jgi:hypothetical protein
MDSYFLLGLSAVAEYNVIFHPAIRIYLIYLLITYPSATGIT